MKHNYEADILERMIVWAAGLLTFVFVLLMVV